MLDIAAWSVSNLSFMIADIDGSGTREETLVATASRLRGGTLEISVSGSAGVAASGIAALFGFGASDIGSVQVEGSSAGGTRTIGCGIDNVRVAPIPLPSGALPVLGGLGGLAATRPRQSRG